MPPSVLVAGVYSGPGHVDGPPSESDEFVVLVNLGDEPANLRGWSLTNLKHDQADHFRYLFPRFLSNGDLWELEPGGLLFLYTGRGTNGCTATAGEAHQYRLFQHRTARIWMEPGEKACLYNQAGKLVSACELPRVQPAV